METPLGQTVLPGELFSIHMPVVLGSATLTVLVTHLHGQKLLSDLVFRETCGKDTSAQTLAAEVRAISSLNTKISSKLPLKMPSTGGLPKCKKYPVFTCHHNARGFHVAPQRKRYSRVTTTQEVFFFTCHHNARAFTCHHNAKRFHVAPQRKKFSRVTTRQDIFHVAPLLLLRYVLRGVCSIICPMVPSAECKVWQASAAR